MSVRTELRKLETDVGKLLETHEKSHDLGSFKQYADDPLGFIRDVLDAEPWSAQVEIIESVRDHPMTVVRSCNAAGKDFVAARLALWWSVCRGGLAILTGPTQRQVRSVLFKEIRKAWSGTDLPGELYEQELRVDRETGAGAMGFTSSEVGARTGFHHDVGGVLGIITEAQSCAGTTFEAMLACAVGEDDRILAVGNPLLPHGEFFTISQPGSGWNSIRIRASDHPNVIEDRTVIPGGVTRAFVERIRNRYGEGSSIYMSRCEGEFPTESSSGLFNRDRIDAAAEVDVPKAGKLVAALDVARMGPDSSVLGIRRGGRLLALHEWRKATTVETTNRAAKLLFEAGFRPRGRSTGVSDTWPNTATYDREPVGTVVVDMVGLGAGAGDQLKNRGFNVMEYNAGRKARRSKRYANRRSEDFWHLRTLLEEGQVRLPAHEQLTTELLCMEWAPDGKGRVTLESKDAIRDKLGASPDFADCCAMLFSDYGAASQTRQSVVHW